MPGVAWERRWRHGRRAEDQAGLYSPSQAGGESLDRVLRFGARALLMASGADRVGLWFPDNRSGDFFSGCTVDSKADSKADSIPEPWSTLDVSAPFLRAALESSTPLRVDLAGEESTPPLGPLTGMRSAVWVPLRACGRSVGLGMVGYAKVSEKLNMHALQKLGEEIAIAVQDFQRSVPPSPANEEASSQLNLLRSVLCGAASDSVFQDIAAAVKNQLGAEFVALGHGNLPPLAAGAWDGAPEWLPVLRQESILQLWRKVQKDGRIAEISGDEAAKIIASSKDAQPARLNRIIAVPIEVRGKARGVLMAGLSQDGKLGGDLAVLESYAMLASVALDFEAAGEERTATEKVFRRMVEESSDCLIVIDEGGKILQTSRPAAALLFAPWGRMDGILLEELFFPATRNEVIKWRGQFLSAARALTTKWDSSVTALEGPLERGGTVRIVLRCEIPGNGKNGPRWLLHLEKEKSQQAKGESDERLEAEMTALLASIESGVLILDADGRIRMASDRLGAIFGLESRRLLEFGTIQSLIDHLACHFAHPAAAATQWHERIRQGEEASWDEIELVRPSRKIVECFARPLYKPDGTKLGWLEVYRDITGQRLIQSKMLQTEKMAALGQLVSGIAHELNNPLTSIQGYAQLLLSRRTAPERAADAQRISQEAERAGRIVKNLLLFSREAKSERRAVQWNEVIERTLSLRAYELKLENIVVDLDLDPGLPQVLADAAQLQQVVLNLIVNAEQAIVMGRTEEDATGHILIRTRRLAGDRVQLEVTDDGPGIPPEIISRIFDPFFTTKPPGIGTGLGLSIVYGIIQEHGGEVTVENLKGRGATLSIELPALSISGFTFVAEKPANQLKAFSEAALPALGQAEAKKRILIVEDEPTVAELIAEVMTDEGHLVETLLDSRAALGRLEEKQYSLVICDLKMPYVDGPGLYRSLVRKANPMQHKLLFVTGDTMGLRTLEFLKSSGLPYLAKPFLVEELKEAVSKALAAGQIAGQIKDQGIEDSPSGTGHSRAAGQA